MSLAGNFSFQPLIIISRHHVPFFDNVHLTKGKGIHMQLRRQFIDRRFHREQSLSRAVAPERSCCHDIGIDHITDEAKRFRLAVEGYGLMAG